MLDRLRAFLNPRRYVIAVVTGIAALTVALLLVTDALSARFAAQLRDELEARAQHGARELAAVAAVGAATDDPQLFNHAIEDYVTSANLKTIAIEAHGKTLVSHGDAASVRWVLAASEHVLVRGPGYVGSWAAGPAGTKVAVVLSTAVLDDADALQSTVWYLLLAVGAAAAVGFVLVRRWRTPVVVRVREIDAPPAEPIPPDNRALEATQRTLQQLLVHADQGFVVVDLATQLVGAHAKLVERWLGAPDPDATLGGYLGGGDIMTATELSAGTMQLQDGSAPLAEVLAQLPARITRDERTFDVRYAPILNGGRAERLLVILDDITEALAREAAAREAREQRDVAALAELLTSNRSEFDEFYAEIARLVASFEAPAEAEAELGAVRAIKDNCAYYGLEAYVETCTAIEASLRETEAPMTDEQRLAVSDGWGKISSRLMRISAAAS